MDKHIDGFRGFLGFYFGKNTKLYMYTSGKVFYSVVAALGVGGAFFGLVYLVYCVLCVLLK